MLDLINMDIMLTQAAIDAFMANADGIFTHEKNFFWMDRSTELCPEPYPDADAKRIHFPWDLDESVGNAAPDIYGRVKGNGSLNQTDTQEIIFSDPSFRKEYNVILDKLASDTFTDAAIAYLDTMEEVIRPFLEADPNSKVGGDVPGVIQSLREYIDDRAADIRFQICHDDPDYCEN